MDLFLISAGTVLILYTVFLMFHSNMNLGVVMPLIMGAPLIVTGIFFDRIATTFPVILYLMAAAYGLFMILFTVMVIKIILVPEGMGKPDAVIVLGCAVRHGKPSLALEKRLGKAFELLMRYDDTVCVVSGGRGPQEVFFEADVMKDLLVRRGIAEERILKEMEAKSTYENMEKSALVLRNNGFLPGTVSVVTTDFHALRARSEALKFFKDVQIVKSRSEWYMKPSYYLRETAAITRRFLLRF